jgi:hypothetical protein
MPRSLATALLAVALVLVPLPLVGCGGGDGSGAPAAVNDAGPAPQGGDPDGASPPSPPGADGGSSPDAAPPAAWFPAPLPSVAGWLGAHVPGPSAVTDARPLVVVLAAGTNNSIHTADLKPASSSNPDSHDLPWWDGGASGFQAGLLAIAAMRGAGWGPCDLQSSRIHFVTWGYGDDTSGADFYYRAPDDVGADLFLVHSLGGANAAIGGPLNGGLPAYTAVSLDNDAHALAGAIDSYAAVLGARPQVVLVAHSWGAAYASYFVDRYYSKEASPAYDLDAALLAATPSNVLTRPGAFGLLAGPCPEYLDYTLLTTSCNVRDCVTISPSPTHAAFCDLGDHADALRSTPTYSFERPDDPIPPANASTIAAAWQAWQNQYPGINGHDYVIRSNDGYAVDHAWAWDTGESSTCAASQLAPRDFVHGSKQARFVGMYGIDTLDLSCSIGQGTGLYFDGSCNAANRIDTSSVGVSLDATCGSTVPGVVSDNCILGTAIDPVTGQPSLAQTDTCFVTSKPYDTPSPTSDMRAAAGFVSCQVP